MRQCMNPSLSVIVPTFQCEAYVSECIIEYKKYEKSRTVI